MDLKNIDLEERMKFYHVNGLSITLLENGQIGRTVNKGLLEAESNREVNNDSIFNACSISKLLTGILAMKLSDEGILHLDEDVNKRLISWKVPKSDFTGNQKVTLRNLLSHQSGIIDPEDSFSELDPQAGIPSIVALLEGETPYCRVPIKLKCEPESEFHYSDAGFCIIQQLIEDVTAKAFHQVMNEKVFEPLGMGNSHLDMASLNLDSDNFSCGHNRNGVLTDEKYPIYPYPAASGLWTSSFDLAKLVLELINAAKGKSEIGLSENAAKEMITPQRGKSWAGLGVFLEGSGEKLEIASLGWGVGFQCMMAAYPYQGKGAVIMTNGELGVHQMEGIIGEIYKSLFS
ncbi:serine hydrolase domain-containing protein [Oceanobacillus neutriphilus]|uniref:Penicillin-binding protein n=1 Tax=Oceanobacillus neutriphilus TaxID=531815 RepID=A0ABQ2P1N7_9BACI|nr:serine hydrolase domain-containing protein [Oceanobacillus neutriphilus]GGP15960.1 penicillin-binding protein [Oceanobacillus neutriphilus]